MIILPVTVLSVGLPGELHRALGPHGAVVAVAGHVAVAGLAPVPVIHVAQDAVGALRLRALDLDRLGETKNSVCCRQ